MVVNVLSVRLGGIYALQRLANEHPKQYHIQIMNLFCSFVRRPTGDEYGNVRKTEQTKSEKVSDADEELRIREDVQAAMEAIGYRSKEGISLEKGSFEINLKGAFLRHAKLDGVDLSGALFGDADFAHAEFLKANLSNAVFGSDANLSETKFKEANLSGAGLSGVTRLWRTNFSSADLSNASLMGANLSKAVLEASNSVRHAARRRKLIRHTTLLH